ncbi:SDR family NAD(P)-dependent oxidoreductase [Oceaniovalibus guishaninsula]|nr:SDR family oxidoreductase [Oceaniovalibus guishaninsula]
MTAIIMGCIDMHKFDGRTAIVTGAASGIGAAIARDLAQRGARVVAADLDADKARSVADEIGNGALSCRVDTADADSVAEMVALAMDRTGALHHLVNNAGIGGPQAIVGEYPLDGWRQVIDINLNGVFYGMRFALPRIEESGGGSIVNMGSILSSVGIAESAAYVAAKHALIGLTRSAAIEYGQRGVRINVVGPGFIDTPLLSALPEDRYAGLTALHPIGRLGTSEEVSALTCFLLSDAASFITGSYHLVDGGYTAP